MRTGISDAFRRHGAVLHNVNWSVSAWAPDGSLVVSLWHHHELKGYARGVLAFGDRFDRWSGLGNKEFRANVARALETDAKVRLVIVRTEETEHIERGDDASGVVKTFAPREDLIGRVAQIDGERYVIEFRRR